MKPAEYIATKLLFKGKIITELHRAMEQAADQAWSEIGGTDECWDALKQAQYEVSQHLSAEYDLCLPESPNRGAK